MKNVIIAPDSFKGTLSSPEVCSIISDTLKEKYPDCITTLIPVADGGEGTSEAYLNIFGGKKVYMKAKSPLGRDIDVWYALLTDGTAVIETAAASGITIEKENNPLLASTYGTGQMLLHALKNGSKKLILGLGGSATTDGGTGLLCALGVSFKDKDGKEIEMCGKNLSEISSIDVSDITKELAETEITVLCDVKNPLYGENGAAYVYAPQKGATKEEVALLDEGLRRLAEVSKEVLKADFSRCEGAGAAGGLGFALVGFLNARLRSGIDAVLDAVSFEEKAKKADLIITGEGRMDEQSFMGKVPFGVASRSGKTRVAAVVGIFEGDREKARENGISEIYETNALHKPFEEILHRARQDLINTVNNIEI